MQTGHCMRGLRRLEKIGLCSRRSKYRCMQAKQTGCNPRSSNRTHRISIIPGALSRPQHCFLKVCCNLTHIFSVPMKTLPSVSILNRELAK